MFVIKSFRCMNLIRNMNTRQFSFMAKNQVTNFHIISLRGTEKILTANPNLQFLRYKKKEKRAKTTQVTDSEEEEETEDFENEIPDKQTKLMTVKVNSLRADVIVKAGLGLARNKIETMFYENKIRVNGQKLLKKSEMLSEGDEIDIIKGKSVANPDFLTVSRVEFLSYTGRNEGLSVKLRRTKSLTIENYPHDPYKG